MLHFFPSCSWIVHTYLIGQLSLCSNQKGWLCNSPGVMFLICNFSHCIIFHKSVQKCEDNNLSTMDGNVVSKWRWELRKFLKGLALIMSRHHAMIRFEIMTSYISVDFLFWAACIFGLSGFSIILCLLYKVNFCDPNNIHYIVQHIHTKQYDF